MRNFELNIIRFFRDISIPFIDNLMQIITFFGEQYVLILVLSTIYFVFNKEAGEKIAYSIFTSLGLNNIFKGIIKINRPFVTDPTIDAVRIETATGYSFPSGHSQNAAVTFSSVAYHFKKKWLWITASILIFLVGISRVFLGVHYLSDVIVGISLGLGSTLLCSLLYEKFKGSLLSKSLLFGITLLAFVPFLALFYRPNQADMLIYKDFYTAFALFLGFIPAVIIENKFVNFNCLNSLKIRLIRLAIGLVIILGTYVGLKMIFPPENIYFDMLRYFLVIFIGLGIYPLIAKKWLFRNEFSNPTIE
ncbi:MAG: phosphatase PAP2 family protein [Bacilli bacterium]|jgi:membrane-associated phospholipid phosphatase|nr:phosphatase PAP2 family protein [Bacilli bacterium]MDD2682140.1 phosphatase PAP2 family protein [Bacilli bacterium]MDD3121754.1 phosphatase PAP2 family protein [Bacilli bacterium]MDD4063682.1 phosphatase PAP2 family protein [Bacilli bacterium]MDD4482546.1 phosphatase PAP2 family protein [Bacilli bacterium]